MQLRLGGQSISVSAKTEDECKAEARVIKSDYLKKKLAEKKPRIKSEPITLGQAIDKYIASKSNILSPSTIRGYKTIRQNRFTSMMNKNIAKISDIDWIKACNEEAAMCSAKTLTNAWRFIATVIRAETGTEPPRITLPQVAPNERPFLEHSQIKIFVKAVEGTEVEIPALLALSSLRRSEICALKWENIDFDKRRIKVSGAAVFGDNQKLVQKKENKNKSSTRYVPILMDELYIALERNKKESGLILSCNPNTIWSRINRICKANDLPQVGVHGLRHSFASLAYHLGVPEKIVMEIGGWADSQTMRKIYTHVAKSDVSRYETEMTQFFKSC